jgi:hypothetical protein
LENGNRVDFEGVKPTALKAENIGGLLLFGLIAVAGCGRGPGSATASSPVSHPVTPAPPAQTLPVQESDAPDKAMIVPVTALADYMAHPDGAVLPPVFVDDGLVIVEDFAPYIFLGRDGAAHWDAGIRQHVARLKDLKFTLGPAHDFNRTDDRVYFVLPTTWRGVSPEGRFEEHGAWSFVLQSSRGEWRILAYGWGVTDEQLWPMHAKP